MKRYLLDTGPTAALLLSRPAVVSLATPWLRRHEAATVTMDEDFQRVPNLKVMLLPRR